MAFSSESDAPGDKPVAEPGDSRVGGPLGVLPHQEIVRGLEWPRPLVLGGAKPQVESASYDLRVGTIFHEGSVDKEQVVVEPGGILVVVTQEELDLPADVCATAYAINSLSKEGLLVLNPGHVDPGYKGTLTVRLLNIRKTRKAISQGSPVFTVVFERLQLPTVAPYRPTTRRKEDLIRELNDNDVQQNPGSLTKLVVTVDDKSPFPTKEYLHSQLESSQNKVEEKLRNSWLYRITFGVSAAAAIGLWVTTALSIITRDDPKTLQFQDQQTQRVHQLEKELLQAQQDLQRVKAQQAQQPQIQQLQATIVDYQQRAQQEHGQLEQQRQQEIKDLREGLLDTKKRLQELQEQAKRTDS